MNNLVRSIGAMTAAVCVAASPSIFAQDDERPQQGQQPSEDPQGQQAQQPAQGQQAQPASKGKITKKIDVDERVSFPLENGCAYAADVKGSIKPAGGDMVEPDLKADVTLSCPSGTKKISEKLSHTGPITLAELEDRMERGATFLSGETGRTCVYRPDFDFSNEKLTGLGVAYLCPSGPRAAQQ